MDYEHKTMIDIFSTLGNKKKKDDQDDDDENDDEKDESTPGEKEPLHSENDQSENDQSDNDQSGDTKDESNTPAPQEGDMDTSDKEAVEAFEKGASNY